MIDVSVIIPVYNGEKWIENCMKSIAAQSIFNTELRIEIVVYNDGSNDKTIDILEQWAIYFKAQTVSFVLASGDVSKGVGAAKNNAIRRSTGEFLCFQDIDDVMHPDRIFLQWKAARENLHALVGSKVSRVPPNSTPRFVRWANNLSSSELKIQVYTSNGPTVLMPTWFCHRSVYDKVGGFDETGCGTPEDLIFFYRHIDAGGDVIRIDEKLVIYTYHEDATTFAVTRKRIWQIQLQRLERCVLSRWSHFTVWNAGKWGRRLVRSLSPDILNRVVAFCDVDKHKIGRTIELYCPIKRAVHVKLPVLHYTNAKPPLLICVKLDLTNGQFERNLKSLNLTEGIDYVLFC